MRLGIILENGLASLRKRLGFRTYKVRLRVRIPKALTTEKAQLAVTVLGRSVKITGQEKGEPLNAAKWLLLSARGFSSRRRAQEFGDQLRNMVEVACLAARLGVDVGQGNATTSVNEEWARSLGLIKPHERVSPNVHGLLVVEDDENIKFPVVNATATVTADPAQLVAALGSIGKHPLPSLGKAASGLRIMNLSLMAPEPIAQMVLAFSAVEELGQAEAWTEAQRELLNRVADEVAAGSDERPLPTDERAEVAEAIRRSTFRVGLRQGVLRILRSYGLGRLVKEWDRLYGLRSGVIHGTSRLSEQDVANLALQAQSLCAVVIMTILKKDGVDLPKQAELHFKQLQDGVTSDPPGDGMLKIVVPPPTVEPSSDESE